MNCLTAKSYIVDYQSATPSPPWQRLKPNDIVLSRILPLTPTHWMFSGPGLLFGQLGDAKLAVAIGSFRQNHPDSLYADAPELLEQAWHSVEVSHQDFMDYFGGDIITLSGDQLHVKLQDYQAHLTQQQLNASGIDGNQSIKDLREASEMPVEDMEDTLDIMGVGKAGQKRLEQQPISTMMRPTLELPKHLRNADHVTVLTDMRGGQVFLSMYHDLENDIAQAQDCPPEEIVTQLNAYLSNLDIQPFVWQRIAQQSPEALATFFRVGLGRDAFEIETDLMLVLAQYHDCLHPQLPETASVPQHLHDLFQRAVSAAKLTKTKKKSKSKTVSGFG